MSDVKCLCCGEPWSAYHMRYDLLAEITSTSAEHKELNKRLGIHLDAPTRQALRALDGWEFGATRLYIKHCPACEKGTTPVSCPEVAEIEAMLQDDPDALESELGDYFLLA